MKSKREKRFLKSLKYALRGVTYCINNERNMRTHTVAALYIFAFPFFFGLICMQYVLLFITLTMVMGAKLFDVVAEEISDMLASSLHPVVRIIEDLAAGTVLVLAGFAMGVGLCLFWRPIALLSTMRLFLCGPLYLCALIFVTAADMVYILLGPVGIRDILHCNKNEKSNQK